MTINLAGYRESDFERFVDEPPKRQVRSAFARDRARILHSSALRRLAAKTQIHTAGTSDFLRTRLTHTLEVSQIGRELGEAFGCDADLVEVGCLAHDIGHPPFGHNGEAALNIVMSDFGGFEGNAQNLRVLSRLESKTFDSQGNSLGLNLTRASLDAAIKYPWSHQENPVKFGYYIDDAPIFNWIRKTAGEGQCFEAQVMDWADDVAYSVHDVEDAIVSRHLSLSILDHPDEVQEVITLAQRYYTDANETLLSEAIARLKKLEYWVTSYDESQRSLARLKNFTSLLIGRFCSAVIDETKRHYQSENLTRYSANLVVPDWARHEVAILKTLANRYVMQREGVESLHQAQQEKLAFLVQYIVQMDGEPLEPWLQGSWQHSVSDAERLRVAVDQVASLTDISAEAWFRKFSGHGS
jgi:dGTPase